jgi:hypothetical protein
MCLSYTKGPAPLLCAYTSARNSVTQTPLTFPYYFAPLYPGCLVTNVFLSLQKPFKQSLHPGSLLIGVHTDYSSYV